MTELTGDTVPVDRDLLREVRHWLHLDSTYTGYHAIDEQLECASLLRRLPDPDALL